MLPACTTQQPDPAVLDNLAEMQIRMQLLQSELASVRRSLAEHDAQREQARRQASRTVLEDRLDELSSRLAALPEAMAQLCPELPESATVTTQCGTTPDVQRVVVSGDKLVVGEVERVWLDPPGTLMTARIDAAADISALHAREIVEFERDGNKWVRFEVTVDDEPVIVERRLKRYVRGSVQGNGGRRPAVDMRVQIGDVRQTVELALADLGDADQPMILGRPYLTDVALLDVARKFVQPAFSQSHN
ncbi:MAG: RimK/LysX family protein [Gammaproteobacteria bacterium]|nr:RimK/LysX family protein [Gammaproteobacteria bacterium]